MQGGVEGRPWMDGKERDGEMMSVERTGDRLKITKVSLSGLA